MKPVRKLLATALSASLIAMTLFSSVVIPAHAATPSGFHIVSIALSGNTLYGLLQDGRIVACGGNDHGQLGIGDTATHSESVLVPGITTAVAIAAAGTSALALLSDGTVVAWGSNAWGQFGFGDGSDVVSPTVIPGYSDVKQIAVDLFDVYLLLTNGTVVDCGYNTYGQLGMGNTATVDGFTQIPGLSNVKAITAGVYSTYALLNNGTVKSWGENSQGELGLGNEKQHNSPTLVSGVSNVKQITSKSETTHLLLNDGTVMASGDDSHGEFGFNCNGDTGSDSFVAVPALSGITQMDSGYMSGCALASSGQVYTYGYGVYGELGCNLVDTVDTPQLVTGINTAIQVVAGYFSVAALLPDGTVMAWGLDDTGELGDGTTNQEAVPIVATEMQDTTSPSGSFSLSKSGWTCNPVVITVNAVDTWSGVASITTPSSTVNSDSATYTAVSSGTYNFTLTDHSGNSCIYPVTVSNIDTSVNVTHTVSTAYTFDPNTNNLSISDTNITNNNQHVGVSVQLKWNASSGIVDRPSNYFADWSKLNVASTVGSVSLGVGIDTTAESGWYSLLNTNSITSDAQTNFNSLGVLLPGGSGLLKYQLYAGIAWPSEKVFNQGFNLSFAPSDCD